TIRKVAPVGTNWVVTTIAGSPAGDSGSDDGMNSAARFYQPIGIALDGAGNLYLADSGNHTIREITPVGDNWVVTTIAGTARVAGSDDGTNQAALFNNPWGIAVDASNNVFVADTGNHTIRKLTPAGTNWVSATIAGTAGVKGSANGANQTARFDGPTGLAVDAAGRLYVADANNDTIRMLTPVGTNWVVTTIAGQAQAGGHADGTGADAQFFVPSAITVDTNGYLYVADTYNHTVRNLIPSGNNWRVVTLAGTPTVDGSRDGIVQHALFNYPFGIAADTDGHLFVGDTLNSTIRMGWFTPVPDVAVSAPGPDGSVISWVGMPFFTLQTNADLTNTNWVDYDGSAVNANGTNSITFPLASGCLFFRLRD